MNMTQASRVFCGLPLQVSESFASSDLPLDQLWRLVGPFVEVKSSSESDPISSEPTLTFSALTISAQSGKRLRCFVGPSLPFFRFHVLLGQARHLHEDCSDVRFDLPFQVNRALARLT
jgi:hypothetical protein